MQRIYIQNFKNLLNIQQERGLKKRVLCSKGRLNSQALELISVLLSESCSYLRETKKKNGHCHCMTGKLKEITSCLTQFLLCRETG